VELRVPSVEGVAMTSPVELQARAQELDVLRRQVETASARLHGEAAGMVKLARAFKALPPNAPDSAASAKCAVLDLRRVGHRRDLRGAPVARCCVARLTEHASN
jgi:hypothetical protein